MTFLSMIIALSLHQVLQPDSVLHRDGWLVRWDELIGERISSRILRAAVTLGLLGLAGVWVLGEIEGWLFGLASLLASAGLFTWSLGRDDYHTALERYEARRMSDTVAARQALRSLWIPESGELSDTDLLDVSEESEEAALQRLVYSGYARWFAPLFYFLLAGPVAALLYRATASLAQRHPESFYMQVLRWMDWLPARLLGLTFALSGDFMAVSKCNPLAFLVDGTAAPKLLRELVEVACSNVSGARVIGDILYRSAGLWLLVIASVLILG